MIKVLLFAGLAEIWVLAELHPANVPVSKLPFIIGLFIQSFSLSFPLLTVLPIKTAY